MVGSIQRSTREVVGEVSRGVVLVEEEDEMQAVFKVFEQMLDDVDLEM